MEQHEERQQQQQDVLKESLTRLVEMMVEKEHVFRTLETVLGVLQSKDSEIVNFIISKILEVNPHEFLQASQVTAEPAGRFISTHTSDTTVKITHEDTDDEESPHVDTNDEEFRVSNDGSCSSMSHYSAAPQNQPLPPYEADPMSHYSDPMSHYSDSSSFGRNLNQSLDVSVSSDELNDWEVATDISTPKVAGVYTPSPYHPTASSMHYFGPKVMKKKDQPAGITRTTVKMTYADDEDSRNDGPSPSMSYHTAATQNQPLPPYKADPMSLYSDSHSSGPPFFPAPCSLSWVGTPVCPTNQGSRFTYPISQAQSCVFQPSNTFPGESGVPKLGIGIDLSIADQPSLTPDTIKGAGEKATNSDGSSNQFAPLPTSVASPTSSVASPYFPGARLVLKKMVMKNFMCQGEQCVGPFDKSFSAILGPVGNEKRNAFLFVFGKTAKDMGLTRLDELIYGSSASAQVIIHLEKSIDLDGEYEVLPGTELTISRTTYRESCPRYKMNGISSSRKEIVMELKRNGVYLSKTVVGFLEDMECKIGTNKYVEKIKVKDSHALADELKQKNNVIKKLKSAIEAMSKIQNEIATSAHKVEQECIKQLEALISLEQIGQKAMELVSVTESEKSQGSVLKEILRAKRTNQIKGIHGRMGDLGAIDAKYDVAISTACPGLDYILVETAVAAQKCVDLVREKNLGVATFLILEDQERHLEQVKRKVNTPEGVPRLFDLIKVKDERFKPGFYEIMRNTVVARDLEQASRIAFDRDKEFKRAVTLEGALFESEKSGILSVPCGGKMGTSICGE